MRERVAQVGGRAVWALLVISWWCASVGGKPVFVPRGQGR